MDVGSNWGNQRRSGDQFNNKEFHDCEALLPYQSLLSQLHKLDMKHDISFVSDRYKGSTFSLTSHMRHQIWTLKRELRFQQMVFMLLQNHGVMSEGLNNVLTIAEKEAESVKSVAVGLNCDQTARLRSYFLNQWASEVPKFLETIDQKIKPDLKEFCLQIVHQLLQGNSSREYDIFEFIDIILLKQKNLEDLKPNLIAPLKKQMETLEVMLNSASIIVRKERNHHEDLQNFFIRVGPWVNVAAALGIMYWVDEKVEELFAVISHSLHKLNLSIQELVGAYIVVIKSLKPSNVSEIRVIREAVRRLTDVLLENLNASTDDHFEMFRERLTLWIALLMDPPQADTADEKLICAQTNLLVDEAESLIHSLCLDKLGEDITEKRNILLDDFLEKMNKAKAGVRQLHVKMPGLSWNNVPRTNGRGSFDFLLGNLQKKLKYEAGMFPFEKHLIETVIKELQFLKPFLMDIFELQDEHRELGNIWVQASNMVYLVDYIADSCLSCIDVPNWSNLMYLSNAMEKIQFFKTEISKFRKNDQMNKSRVIGAKENSKVVLPRRQQANVTDRKCRCQD